MNRRRSGKAEFEDIARLVLGKLPADDDDEHDHGNSTDAARARVTLPPVAWTQKRLEFWDDPIAFGRACASAKAAQNPFMFADEDAK